MNDKLVRIKQHVSDNKAVYVTGAVSSAVFLTVGTGIGLAFGVKNFGVNNAVALRGDVYQNLIQMNLKGRMHPGIRLLHNETGITYPSVRYAAEVLQLNRNKMHKHLKGLLPDIDGQTFTDLGMMTFGSQELQGL